MYIYAEFAELKNHLDILYEEKRTIRRLIEKFISESSFVNDGAYVGLRRLAEQGKRLESSIDNRIGLIEDIISDFKEISRLNSEEINRQISYFNRLLNV